MRPWPAPYSAAGDVIFPFGKSSSINPELPNKIRSTPYRCDGSSVAGVLSRSVRCPPSPTLTTSSVPNGELNIVTADGNTPSPVNRSGDPSAVDGSPYPGTAVVPGS